MGICRAQIKLLDYRSEDQYFPLKHNLLDVKRSMNITQKILELCASEYLEIGLTYVAERHTYAYGTYEKEHVAPMNTQ